MDQNVQKQEHKNLTSNIKTTGLQQPEDNACIFSKMVGGQFFTS